MAHITFTTNEKKALQATKLPEGTTLVQCRKDEYGTPMYRFRIENGKWIMDENFVERDRAWKKGEQEEFEQDMSRERIVDFFLRDGDRGPQREYNAMSKAEHTYLNFASHAGTYQADEKSGEHRNVFKIKLNRDSDLDAAEEEITWVFNKVAKAYPKWNPIYIDVFEHTLSEYGIYFIYWNRRKTFRLMKCTYGHEEELTKFTNWRSMLEYISKNHYYE
jgi:hypothetical protein